MKGKRYNMQLLVESGMFDVNKGQLFCYTIQEYFDALTEFLSKHISGFGNYTPAFVVNSEDERNCFLQECYEARAVYIMLGMTALMDAVNVMEDAALKRDMDELSDGQVKFRATLKICTDILRKAEMRWMISR